MMRIALVHGYYSSSQPSGETLAVDYQVSALESAGHALLMAARHTDVEAARPLFPVRSGWRVMTGHGYDPSAELRAFHPEIVHIHNWFPTIGTNWLQKWDGPVVATVHNFRPLCSAATLYRDGSPCFLCPDGNSLSAVRHRCYRDSRLATIPLAVRTRNGATGDPVLRRADKIICLSERSAEIYTRYGVPSERLAIIPNFIRSLHGASAARGSGWLYVGRLAPEKGIMELLDAWPVGERLDIYGAGPLERAVRARVDDLVRFRGMLEPSEVVPTMKQYEGVVISSRWAEGATTNVLLEALAAGRPVVAARGSAAADEVVQLGAGAVYDRDNAAQLREAILMVRSDPSLPERIALMSERFSEEAWVARVTQLYERLIHGG